MRRLWTIATAVLGVAIAQPALACRVSPPIVLGDVKYADLVIVGRISGYRIVRDQDFRRRMLSNPNLSSDLRRRYEGPGSLLPDYARFEIQVEKVLAGRAPKRVSVTWDNSTFAEPEKMGSGPFLIALRQPSSKAPPLRGPSTTFFPNPEPGLFTLLQAPCSAPFLFDSQGNEANLVRKILGFPQLTADVSQPLPSQALKRPNPMAGKLINKPDWLRKPSSDDISRYYPSEAKAAGRAGSVLMTCAVTAIAGLANCDVKSEMPLGQGFGDAARRLSRLYRMRPRSIDGAAVEGRLVSIELAFTP